MAKHLFLASTPFNMLTAAMTAFELPEEDEAVLGLIDQPLQERNFVSALQQWTGSPFNQVVSLSNQAKGREKKQIRQQGFKNIQVLLEQFPADCIYTGNDRRIEFQFAMHISSRSNPATKGVYIDDGTYSYVGLTTHWFKDKVVDNLVKKLSYGWWWKQPPNIGTSAWISTAILAFPDAAISALKQKNVQQLASNLNRIEFTQLANLALSQESLETPHLSDIEALIMLPHSSVSDPNSNNKLTYWLSSQGAKIAFKHHPRTALADNVDGDKELWGLDQEAQQVPAGIPMEVLLPLLNARCKIAGDVSTALLTAKWLRPELNVTAFAGTNTQDSWIHLLRQLDIIAEQS